MGVDVLEVVMIFDGIKCIDGKVCLNRKCVFIRVLFGKVFLCFKNCFGNGICINIGICYCFKFCIGIFCDIKFLDIKLMFIMKKFKIML